MNKKVFDCFLYNGELELLKIRLAYLSDVVDFFVICEQAYTFQNNSRQFDLKAREVIQKVYGERVRWHLDSVNLPDATTWEREIRARNLLALGLFDCTTQDVVLISDVDEIPSTNIFSLFDDTEFPAVCKQEFRVFDPHFRSSLVWMGTVITRFDLSVDTIQEKRNVGSFWWTQEKLTFFEQGGWHLTSIGNAKKLMKKIKSFSHSELTTRGISNHFHLSVLTKLGVAIQGNEVYKLDRDLPEHLESICRKCHKFDKFRFMLGLVMRPYVRLLFKCTVKTLNIK